MYVSVCVCLFNCDGFVCVYVCVCFGSHVRYILVNDAIFGLNDKVGRWPSGTRRWLRNLYCLPSDWILWGSCHVGPVALIKHFFPTIVNQYQQQKLSVNQAEINHRPTISNHYLATICHHHHPQPCNPFLLLRYPQAPCVCELETEPCRQNPCAWCQGANARRV